MSNKRELIRAYLKDHPIQASVAGQYEKIGKALGMDAENVRNIIKYNNLAPNVYCNSQAKRVPVEVIKTNAKSQDEAELDRQEFWDSMKQRSEKYITRFEEQDTIELSVGKGEWIGICLIADTHFGNEGVDYTKAERDARIIASNPYLFTIHAGDEVDMFIKANIMEGVINATTSPKQQVKLLDHWLNLLGDSVLAMIMGNHDSRIKETTGLDVVGHLIRSKKIFYSPYQFHMKLHIGSQEYSILMRHQFRFNSTDNLTHTCKKLLQKGQYDADIICIAHNHEFALEVFEWRRGKRIALRPATYKVADTYANKVGYVPSSATMPVLIFNPTTKEMIPMVDIDRADHYLRFLNSELKSSKSTKK